MVLEFLKLLQKHEVKWLRLATEDVKDQYDIQFEWGERHFVQKFSKKHSMTYITRDFVVEWQILVLSGMIVCQVNKKEKTVFSNATTELIKKEVWFGPMVISGHFVRKV